MLSWRKGTDTDLLEQYFVDEEKGFNK